MKRPLFHALSAFTLLPAAFAQPTPMVDPVTGRKIVWHRSDRHETHHYYDIQPWNKQGDKLAFFRFDAGVDKLTAAGRYPGSLWVMNADGTGRREVVGGLKGNYHVGVGQFWGPDGNSVYFTGGPERVTSVISLATGARTDVNTPVAANRLSPDFQRISCVRGPEWGVYDVAAKKYTQLLTRERARAMSPNTAMLHGGASALQNTRFSADGGKIVIVHRDTEEFPRMIEMFLHDFATGRSSYLAQDFHHPGWRPDGKAVMFVRRHLPDSLQALWEVDVETRKETRLTGEHVPAGHPSYHPRKQHLIVTDSYGGPMGFGLALIDTRTKKMTQLVTIPSGAKPVQPGDERFPFRNWGLWMPVRPYLNEPRPVWNHDGSKILFTSQESGRINLYEVDTSDL